MKEKLIEILKNSLKPSSLPFVLYRNEEEKALIDAVFNAEIFREEKTSASAVLQKTEDAVVKKQNISVLSTPAENKSDDSMSLKEYISHCRICGDFTDKKYPSGSNQSKLMIILNAPMLMSTFEKKQYREQSIEMMKNIIEKGIGIELKNIYITNIIKCEADSLMSKPSTMFKNCEKIIKREIKEQNPSVVLVMGDMLPLRPILRTSETIQWYNIDHPITILKHSDLKRKAWNTIVEMKKYMEELV